MTDPIRVLLVEDNPGDAELTRDTLLAGKLHLTIDVAEDGEDALRRLGEMAARDPAGLPDLILLDLNLPGLSGREVLGDLRADEALRRIPVVVLTSSDAEQDIVRSYELGANCYVTKPVGLSAFQSIVRSVEDFWLTVVRLP